MKRAVLLLIVTKAHVSIHCQSLLLLLKSALI